VITKYHTASGSSSGTFHWAARPLHGGGITRPVTFIDFGILRTIFAPLHIYAYDKFISYRRLDNSDNIENNEKVKIR